MKFVLIYGGEATGKLTIARALAAKTGFSVFHNHISIDVAKTLYEYGQPEYDEIVWGVRALVFESAAKNDIPGLIFTWAYTHPECQGYRERLHAIMDKYDVPVFYVHVACEQQELERRVVTKERRLAGKISSVEALQKQQRRKNCQVIAGSDSFEIDNTHLAATAAADLINVHFCLSSNHSQ